MSVLNKSSIQLNKFEWQIILLSIILALIGIALINSAVTPMGEAGKSFIARQIVWCILGLSLGALFLLFDYNILERWSFWIYVAVICALIAVWGLGKVTAGSRRWIELGFMRFQPSEFAKPALVIILAKYLQTRSGQPINDLRELAAPFVITIIPFLLVLIQPDLGTAIIILSISLSMILFSGVGKRILLWGLGVMLFMIPTAYLFWEKIFLEYQRRRFLTFWNPDNDPLGAGYHIIQSQIAIGSGGLTGKGYLMGTQNQLMFLPVKHTDFIFSILAEEWGFLGCSVVILLFAWLFLRGLTNAARAGNDFGALVTFGCVVILFLHVVINIGMVMGLVPVVGVPLSFISYGGSSLLVSFFCVSVISNVAMRRFAY